MLAALLVQSHIKLRLLKHLHHECSAHYGIHQESMLHRDGVLFECKYAIISNKINNLYNGSAIIKIYQKHFKMDNYVLLANHDVALTMATGNQLHASIVPTLI